MKGAVMTKAGYTIQFGDGASMSNVEETLLMSVIAAEGIHGRARVRLDAGFNLDHDRRICTVNADNPVGENIARVFVEFLLLDLGEEGFQVAGSNGFASIRDSKGRASR